MIAYSRSVWRALLFCCACDFSARAALDAEEPPIDAPPDSPPDGPGRVRAGLIAFYAFDENGGMTIHDTSVDPDRNGQLFDPLPPGTYSGTGLNVIEVDNDGGRGGARGPTYKQTDIRLGYRFRPRTETTLDAFVEIFNLFDNANFVNPTGDRRSADFLRVTALQGGGPPRMAQLGVRFGF